MTRGDGEVCRRPNQDPGATHPARKHEPELQQGLIPDRRRRSSLDPQIKQSRRTIILDCEGLLTITLASYLKGLPSHRSWGREQVYFVIDSAILVLRALLFLLFLFLYF